MVRHLFIAVLLFIAHHVVAQDNLKLWYDQPAKDWNEALPIGNGRLGAMIFGGVPEELIQLNEATLWSGGPANTNPNPHAPQYLDNVRKALEEENYPLAEELTKKMQGLFTESYEPLGDVKLTYSLNGVPTGYYRDLDISNATATTRFTLKNITYTREIFATAADQVIVLRITASQPKALNFRLETTSPLYFETEMIHSDELALHGKAPSHTDPSYLQAMQQAVVYNDPTSCRGMRFELRSKIRNVDGTVTAGKSGIEVKDATEVVIYLSAATSFNGFDKCPDMEGKDEKKIAEQHLSQAWAKSFEQLKSSHIADYKKYFSRVSLNINDARQPDVPTDERLLAYTKGKPDTGLEILYYYFGRYLLISSSRPGGMAANLQGIWNHHVRPPWSSNYTTNINTEMNYWMAESGNLSELHKPLLDLIGNLVITGRQTVRNFYNAPGWTLHHNTDIWAASNPVNGSPMWANWPLGGAWLSQHVWEHYSFTGDQVYLKEQAYPVMKEAAVFCEAWLIEDKQGRLVTSPATSPENVFISGKGYKGTVSVATTMDMSLIRDLFTNVIEASEILNMDEDFRKILTDKRDRLFPLQVGKKGNLQEWSTDWEDAEPNHRHISHLFGLFPGREISPLRTPVFAAAARKTLELRGDGGTGWSKGWKINTWARLLDGNHAYKLIREQLTITGRTGEDYTNAGGTYPNLFDAHPPFQIDGNFGAVSGITEMLLQSHLKEIHLLPALPDVWTKGEITGLKARGGFEVAISWKNNKLQQATIKSLTGSTCTIRSATPFSIKAAKAKYESKDGMYIATFNTVKGDSYAIVKK